MDAIGYFTVTSGKLHVTDPCYEPGTWCAGTFTAKNGLWGARIEIKDEGSWGKRVSELIVWHVDHYKQIHRAFEESNIDVGVDSGQCGFFDEEKYINYQGGDYGDLTTFYGQACAQTHDEENPEQRGGIVMGFGAVSSSGFGDGSYDCYVARVNGEVVAARVVFIPEEMDDVEEYNEEEEDAS